MFVWAIFYLYPSSVRFRRWPQTINQPGPPLYFAHPELHDLLDRCSSHLRRVKRNETGSKDWYKCEYDLVLFVFKLLLIWILTSCIYIFKIAKILHTICIDLNRHVLETQNIVGILIHQLYHVHISIFFLWCIYATNFRCFDGIPTDCIARRWAHFFVVSVMSFWFGVPIP